MERTDYFLKNVLVDVMGELGTHFQDEETGKNEDNQIIRDILKDENVKDKFYLVLQNELIKALEEKYPELKGNL